MLYEIISPDPFLRPYIEPLRDAFIDLRGRAQCLRQKVYVDRAFQKKTNELVQKHIGAETGQQVTSS